MSTNPTNEKQTRKKRRVPGTDTPPRVSLVLRMEEVLFDGMNKYLETFDGSRNDYICGLIYIDVKHRERFRVADEPVILPQMDFMDSKKS